MILQKLHVLEKFLSQVINESALSQSDCKIASFNITKTIRAIKFLFLNLVRFSWKLQFDHVIFFGFSHACPECAEINW